VLDDWIYEQSCRCGRALEYTSVVRHVEVGIVAVSN
jgi:hypothetical protein